MMLPMRRVCAWGLLATAWLGWVPGVWAFRLETHRAVNERAAIVSSLDAYLKAELGLRDGRQEVVNSIVLQDWLRIGGAEEDLFLNNEGGGAYNRSRHHFQNSLLPWDQAGLSGRCLFGLFPIDGQASVRWAQSDVDQAGGSARWSDARRLFLDSLVLPTKLERDSAAADLFKILGQQMHLVSDLAVPAHSRNDIHCTPGAETFEIWADARENRQLLSTMQAIGPDPSIFTVGVPIQDPIARVPVARLWDTGTYRAQRNADLTLSGPVGLAEYASANFFSKRTIFSLAFPYPARTSVGANLVTGIDPKTGQLRQYFAKVRDGQPLNRLATPGALFTYVPDALKDKNIGLDSSIFAEYATHLFPRAIGYSAALLDYFFRGRLEAKIGPDPAQPQMLLFAGRNASSEPLNDGTLKVYGDYTSEGRVELGSWTISRPVAPGSDLLPAQPVSVSPPTDRPVPERYMVVYQGSLGEEKKDSPPGFGGAVIGKAAKYVGIIEQIFVNQTDGDVYFRNGTLVTKLNVRSQLRAGSLVSLRSWGARNDTFLVEGAVPGEDVSHFYVFTLSRPQPDRVFGDPPTATLVRGPEVLDVPWMRGLPLGFGGVIALNYLAALDDNLDVILPGYYVVYIPDPYTPDQTDVHGVLLNNTARTVLFDLRASALGAPAGPSVQSEAALQMILRLDATRRDQSRIVVSGSQFDGTGQSWGYLGVVDGNGTEVARFVDWEPSHSAYLLGGLARGGRHLLWAKFDDNDSDGSSTAVYASYVDGGKSTQIGTGEADWELAAGASLVPVASDFLLRTATPAFFVKGWTPDGTVVLAPADSPGFPPEDVDFSSLKRLADLPSGVSVPASTFCGFGYCSVWQVIEDPDLLR
jgi:hypothetical protein